MRIRHKTKQRVLTSKNLVWYLDLWCKNTFFWSVLRGSVDRRHKYTDTGARTRTERYNRIRGRNFFAIGNHRYTRRKGKGEKKKKKRGYDDSERKESKTTTTTTARVVKRERGRTIKSTGRVPTLPLESSRNLACHSRVEACKIPFSFPLG